MSKLPSFFSCVLALAIGLIIGESILFWNFFAEDAYIVMRYAINLKAHGQWVYNLNDYITVMTSPLHGIIESILYFFTNQLPYTNKIVSLITYLIISVVGFRYFKGSKLSQVVFLVFFSTSPFVLLWTMGGLETPYLSLLVFVLIYVINKLLNQYTTKRMVWLAIISGLCFICRYDSILFVVFLFPFTLVKFGWKPALLWAVLASVLPVIWLLFSYHYFGDIFPTSFYIKQPDFSNRSFIIQNLNYSIDFLVTSGLLAFLVIILFWSFTSNEWMEKTKKHFSNFWYAYMGLYMIFLYGLGTATLHMMFSYRMFVPYICVFAFLMADVVKQNESMFISKYFSFSLKALCVLTIVLNLWLTGYIKNTSINPSRVGEGQLTSLTENEKCLDVFAESSEIIKKHWALQPESLKRPPRIVTYAEGIISYVNPDAYIFGSLVSYRKNYNYMNAYPCFDYFYDVTPLCPNNYSSCYPKEQLEMVYSKSTNLNGIQTWTVYFRPGMKEKNTLPNTIADTKRAEE